MSWSDQITYRYNPNEHRHQGITDDWIVDRCDTNCTTFQDYHAPTSSHNPMRRFIGENDFTLFNVAPYPDTPKLPPFQTLDIAPFAYPTSADWHYGMGTELQSPSPSGPSSSYFSSSASDRQSTPYSPPDSGMPTWSPDVTHPGDFCIPFGGGHDFLIEQKHPAGYSCVAMHDVQTCEDPLPDKLAYEDDTQYYGSYAAPAHEGYQPVETNGEVAEAGVESDDNDNNEIDSKDDDYNPRSPNFRRRRSQANRSVTSQRAPTKVTKRSSGGHVKRGSSGSAPNRSSHTFSIDPPNKRPFPCALAPYGCKSTFGSKNEWKRHVNTQHMRLKYWRCDQCPNGNNGKPNDFNRKDLFIQHVRRMHDVTTNKDTKKKTSSKHVTKAPKRSGEDEAYDAIAARCLMQDRKPPGSSGCHWCGEAFDSWEKRLEHVAAHMEGAKGKKEVEDVEHWGRDERLEGWLVNEEVVVMERSGGLVLA